MWSLDDTIAAIVTAPGEGAVAIVRVSGPAAGDVTKQLLEKDSTAPDEELEPRRALLRRLRSTDSTEVLDEVLLLWMPGPHSYTREDVVEFQCHGGRAAAQGVLDAVLRCGARLARPGEFTLRAYLRGRIDLVQAEAVADIVLAQTAEALRVHEGLLAGSLSAEVGAWQDGLRGVLVSLETALDFAEEDLDEVDPKSLLAPLEKIAYSMRQKLKTFSWGRISREGFRVAILGAPNVGKSSLLNRLAEEERAIVSPEPGTTRDTVEMRVNVLGVAVQVIDTAGLRETDSVVETMGMERARRASREADLILFVLDATRDVTEEESRELAALAEGAPLLRVINKCDLGNPVCEGALAVSAKTGLGIDALLEAIRSQAWSGGPPRGEGALTRLRHREAVADALAAVERAIVALQETSHVDAAASELHGARRHLGALLGRGTAEDVLDRIFADFCIGK
jgi:tRNA modification GTPase